MKTFFEQDEKLKNEDIVIARQREIVFTHANSSKPVMATYGAGPCVIFAGYDSKLKIGFLAHLDTDFSNNDFDLISSSLQKLLGNQQGDFKIYLTGGVISLSEPTIKKVHIWLDAFSIGSMSIIFEEYKTHEEYLESWGEKKSDDKNTSFLLDTRNGLVNRYYDPDQYVAGDIHQLGLEDHLTVTYFPTTIPKVKIKSQDASKVEEQIKIDLNF